MLAGCQTTTVHIFEQGVEEDTLSQIIEAVRKAGFAAKVTALPPANVGSPSIIYSPMIEDSTSLTRIHLALSQIGIDVQLIPMSSGNHLYTRNSMGLYFGLDAEPATEGSTLTSRVYEGRCNAQDALLNLVDNKTFSLERLKAPDSFDATYDYGSWTRRDDELDVHFDEGSTRFDVEQIGTESEDGQSLRVALTSRQPGEPLSDCEFSTTIFENNNRDK